MPWMLVKKYNEVKIVVNGAGASAQACTNLFKSSGVKNKNIIMCDSKGVIYKGRKNIDQFKSSFASNTKVTNFKRCYERS